MGAKDVIMVGLSADKALRLDVAYEMGVTEFIASDAEDFVSRIHEVCGVEGADVAIDCAGAPSVLLQAISGVRKDGTIVKVGASTAPLNFSLNDLTYRAQIVKGHHAYDVICLLYTSPSRSSSPPGSTPNAIFISTSPF